MIATLSRTERSRHMGKIRSFGNASTEMTFAKLLRKHGLTGWRRHAAIPGRPDFYFPTKKLAIFLDGCFWHGCPQHFRMPESNVAWWKSKMTANKRRDWRSSRNLRSRGIRVIRIWEHDLRPRFQESVIRRIQRLLAESVCTSPSRGGRRPT